MGGWVLSFSLIDSLAWYLPLYPQAFLFPFLKWSHQRPILPTNYNFARLINLFSPQIWPFPRGKRTTIISLQWKEQIRRDKEPFPSTINFKSHQAFFTWENTMKEQQPYICLLHIISFFWRWWVVDNLIQKYNDISKIIYQNRNVWFGKLKEEKMENVVEEKLETIV